MSKLRFYKDNDEVLIKYGNNTFEGLVELIPNTVEAANEKHIPVVSKKEDEYLVSVGSVLHPMEEKHHIAFVVLETDKGYYVHYLTSNPTTSFKVNKDEKLVAVYEYCNLHGLWKAE